MLSTLKPVLRRLLRERGFTVTVLTTLALCIGANVAIFAVVDAILVRSLPFPQADRLVTSQNSYPKAGVERVGSSLPNYYDRRDNITAFESTSLIQYSGSTIVESGSPRRVKNHRVSPEFFNTLGVALHSGRMFTEDELSRGESDVVVISHEFWQSHFRGADDILGRHLIVNGVPKTVIGVLPPGFRYLNQESSFFAPLLSLPEDLSPSQRHSNGYQLIARLAPGATLAQAQSQIDAFNVVQLLDDPNAKLISEAGYHTTISSLHADTVRGAKPVLLLLQTGVLSLLLIGGVNLVNLLLIRAQGRAREYAVRQALGANGRQLAREIIAETTLLAFLGGSLGLIVGAFGIQLLDRLGSDQLPLGTAIAFDGRVALIALAVSLVVGLALALPVIWVGIQGDVASGLQTETRGGTTSRSTQNLRQAFIVIQISLAFILLSSAGLLGLSLQKVLATSPGFQADNVLTARISLPNITYPNVDDRLAFLERILGELRNQPGVTRIGITSGLPFGGDNDDNATVVEGVERGEGESIRTHYNSFAMGDYWQALGIPLIEGRFLEEADNHRGQRVAVVDQAFAHRYWPGQSALGRRFASAVSFTEENAITIVGVVGTVKQADLSEVAPLGSVFLPYKLRALRNVVIAIRATLSPEPMSRALQKLVLAIDPDLPVNEIRTMHDRIDDSLVARRTAAVLAAIFSAVALLLAAVGTYGVLAYAVSQRRREIGVRMALGAMPQQILKQFLSVGARLLLIGISLGTLGAWGAGRAMQSVLFEVAPFSITIIATTVAVMSIVVVLATLLPSRRASKVDPMEALRAV